MDFVHISSSTNPRYKLARSLLSRRGRKKQAQLLLEGVRLIEDSISAGFPPALVFLIPKLPQMCERWWSEHILPEFR